MLEVPARTLGLSATWSAARWSLSGAAVRATSWINYDRLALATAFSDSVAAGAPPQRLPVGSQLRSFWRTYDGVTRLNARVSYDLSDRTALTAAADNLLGRQLGEPDNLTVLPGRTLTVSFRTGF